MNKLHLGETCPECGGPVMQIMWGFPSEDDLARAERDGLYIGGCIVDSTESRCECGATAYGGTGKLVVPGTYPFG